MLNYTNVSESKKARSLFNFVIPSYALSKYNENSFEDVDDNWQYFHRGEIVWILQTYIFLKQRKLDVELSSSLKNDSINIGHVDYLRKISVTPHNFIVSITADYSKLKYAHVHFVQNKCQCKNRNEYWIPHWPQPGKGFIRHFYGYQIISYIGSKKDWSHGRQRTLPSSFGACRALVRRRS